MDVVDTLRHRQDLVARELDGEAREKQLIDKLREIYHQQGIEVPDAHPQGRRRGARREPLRLYAAQARLRQTRWRGSMSARKRWGCRRRVALCADARHRARRLFPRLRPYQAAQAEAGADRAGRERCRRRWMRSTRRSSRRPRCSRPSTRPTDRRTAARPLPPKAIATAAEQAIADLDRPCATRCGRNISSASSTARACNPGSGPSPRSIPRPPTTTRGRGPRPDGEALSLPILNEENRPDRDGRLWGVRVPEVGLRSVEADKRDDGIIQRNIVGVKQYGFLEIDYTDAGPRRRGDAVVGRHEHLRTRSPALARRGAARHPPRRGRDRQAPRARHELITKMRETERDSCAAARAVRLVPRCTGRTDRPAQRGRDAGARHAQAHAKDLARSEAELERARGHRWPSSPSRARSRCSKRSTAQQAELKALAERSASAALPPTRTTARQAQTLTELAEHRRRGMRKTEQAEADREQKGRPYRDDPLFMYLWERGYGTRNTAPAT